MSTDIKASLVLVLLGLWILAQALGIYGFGLEGLTDSLNPDGFHEHPIDYVLHWVVLIGPPALAVIFGFRMLLRR